MSLYTSYNKNNEIIGLAKGQRVPFPLTSIDNYNIKKDMNVSPATLIKYKEQEQTDFLYKEYKRKIAPIEEENLKKMISQYDYPIFIKFEKSSFHRGKSALDAYQYKANIYLYTYQRYFFIKKVDKLKKQLDTKKSILANIPKNIFNYFKIKSATKVVGVYQKNLDDYINSYINKYMDWLKENFSILHLPVNLFEGLHQRILLSSNENLEKTCIILDEIVEKIELFHLKAKKIKVKNGYQLLIESSVEEFIKYIELKMNVLKDFSILTSYGDNLESIDEKDREALEEIKNVIFNEV